MIESYQQRKAIEGSRHEPRGEEFAVVDEVYLDGITLLFAGETAPSRKRYNYNTAISFSRGQRVKVRWISNTYIVEYPIR